jgi:hypothetical protein
MTPLRILGLILIVLGVVILLWGGIFWKERNTVVDAGPIEINTEQNRGVSVPPIAGGAMVVGGIVLMFVPRRRSA